MIMLTIPLYEIRTLRHHELHNTSINKVSYDRIEWRVQYLSIEKLK